jgi:hypothetical protein
VTVLERYIEDAARSAENLELFVPYLRGLLDAGRPRTELAEMLQRVYEDLLTNSHDEAADLVLDGLDVLTGWCGPGMEIPDHQRV